MTIGTLAHSDSLHYFFRELFQCVPDLRTRKSEIPATDYCMSVFGMFKFKDPSLLSFEHRTSDPGAAKNFKGLFGIEQIASDSMLRQYFDPIEPSSFKPIFVKSFDRMLHEGHLKQFVFLDNSILIATDGTTFYSSRHNFSPTCQTKVRSKKTDPNNQKEVAKQRKNKAKMAEKIANKAAGHPAEAALIAQNNNLDDSHEIEYSLQMLTPAIVKPGLKTVIPLMPEPITGQDGSSKQDCESNACKRFLKGICEYKMENLSFTLLLDSLFSKSPMIHAIRAYGYHYIANAKEGDHKFLFATIEHLKGAGKVNVLVVDEEKVKKTYEWVSNVKLFATEEAPRVNFLKCTIIAHDGKTTVFTWVTDHELNEKSVIAIEKAGRSRWKIENETFNTLKNHGYHFEHNYGLGKKFLAINFAIIMLIAFLSDQILELLNLRFQQLLEITKVRRELWDDLRAALKFIVANSYEDMLEICINRRKGIYPIIPQLQCPS
jgi:hypothetical protein